MTLKELSQVYYLNREIEMDRERLEELRKKAKSPSGSNLSGTFVGGASESNVERYTAEITGRENAINEKIIQCEQEKSCLERYIATIPDSLTRQIFTLRFIYCYSWSRIALSVGGGNTEGSVKMVCYRYLKKSKD